MNIAYPPFVRWMKPVPADILDSYGKKNQKRLSATLDKIGETDISHEIRPLDEDFLVWFEPLYRQNIGSKKNAAVHNLRSMTLENTESLSDYWCLTLKQGDTHIGGTIIGVREDRIMIAYRTYQPKWNDNVSLQANPSLYTEYVATAWAQELGKEWVSHGKDRNPYGLNANIGLALFKLSVGCRASVVEDNPDYEPQQIECESISENALILEYPKEGEIIEHAILWIAREEEAKYAQLFSYSHLLDITVHYRD